MSASSIATTAVEYEPNQHYDAQKVQDLKRRIYLFERTTWDITKTQDFRDQLAEEYAKPGNPNPDAVVDPPRKYRTRDSHFNVYPPKVKKENVEEETASEKKHKAGLAKFLNVLAHRRNSQ